MRERLAIEMLRRNHRRATDETVCSGLDMAVAAARPIAASAAGVQRPQGSSAAVETRSAAADSDFQLRPSRSIDVAEMECS